MASTLKTPVMGNPDGREPPEIPHRYKKIKGDLPLVILYCRPKVDIDFRARFLRSKFRLLNRSDPSFSNLASSARALIILGPPPPLTADVLDGCPSVGCVVTSSIGLDHVDLAECGRRGIIVANAGDTYSDDVADYAVALLIDVLRRISAADRFVRIGSWPVKGEFPLGNQVGKRRVGVLGLGSIGHRIAKRLEAFGCSIAYNSRTKKPHFPNYTYHDNIHDLARSTDVLIVCCRLTEDTHHIVGEDVLTALGENGVVINVGRGALVDEKELVRFLVSGRLRGAGLDVYEDEPNVPSELFRLDNVVLSPHRAAPGTPESLAACEALIMANLEAFFSDRPLLSQVKLG